MNRRYKKQRRYSGDEDSSNYYTPGGSAPVGEAAAVILWGQLKTPKGSKGESTVEKNRRVTYLQPKYSGYLLIN